MGEAGAGVVAVADVARVAEVEAIEADTADVLGDVEVHEVLVAGAEDQAGALPQEGGQVDRGGVIRTWCGAAIASSWQTTSNETFFDLGMISCSTFCLICARITDVGEVVS